MDCARPANQQLLELEHRQRVIEAAVAAAPPTSPQLHPRLAEMYRATVAELHPALDHPDARAEAAEILRGLVERITVRSDQDGHYIEVTGDIVKLVRLPGGKLQLRCDYRANERGNFTLKADEAPIWRLGPKSAKSGRGHLQKTS